MATMSLLVTSTAVNILTATPIMRVRAKPLIVPLPKKNSARAAMIVVTFASRTVRKAVEKPVRKEEEKRSDDQPVQKAEEKHSDEKPAQKAEEKCPVEIPDIPYDQMTVEQLQAVILDKMAKNGPVTDRMRREVMENVWQDSLVNWARSFR